ncbi:YjbF family lipoprotein [Acidimangrovimonas sediminis]|uniref:YjbF family lipoprotein n=1 Tax=Acidimangrovimonas sediminis TaxID=2056283 RepID=UPI000C80148B|nr:YjbF family lipoprotein [Acidimangrovimonas sediminis]
MRVPRALAVLAALTAALAGCGNLKLSSLPTSVTPIQSVSSQSARYPVLVKEGAPAMEAYLEKFKAGTILRLSVLTPDGVGTWLSADGAEVMVRDGMLVETRGLMEDMMTSDVSQSAALVHARSAGQAKRFQSHLNGDHDILIRAYVCNITKGGDEALKFGKISVPTQKMFEDCIGEYGDKFRNIYWVGQGGKIYQSLQYISANGGRLALRKGP